MQTLHFTPKRNPLLTGILFVVILILLAWRLLIPKSELDGRSATTWTEILFLLILYFYANLVGLGLGRFLLNYFRLPLLTNSEAALLADLLGFGYPGWEPLENQVHRDYVYSFGVGKSWSDFLLLVYNLYALQDRFSAIGLAIIHYGMGAITTVMYVVSLMMNNPQRCGWHSCLLLPSC